jgi:uncharacterized SAM-binding protein YcdF (DUF218 family)
MLNTRTHRSMRLWAGSAVLFSLGLAAIFYPFILNALARFLTLSQHPEPADLILVMGGDFWGPRALMGAKLGASGYAKKVLISGPPYNHQPESELSIRFLVEKGYRRDLFLGFAHSSTSTIDEAIALCPELKRLGAATVLIVTSPYHSRRANVVFRLFCPGLKYRSVASDDPQFEPVNWWKTPHDREIFFAEWTKLIGTVFWKYPVYELHRAMRFPFLGRIRPLVAQKSPIGP